LYQLNKGKWKEIKWGKIELFQSTYFTAVIKQKLHKIGNRTVGKSVCKQASSTLLMKECDKKSFLKLSFISTLLKQTCIHFFDWIIKTTECSITPEILFIQERSILSEIIFIQAKIINGN